MAAHVIPCNDEPGRETRLLRHNEDEVPGKAAAAAGNHEQLTREARTDSARRPLLALTYLELEDWRRADSIFRSLGTLNARQRVNRAIVAAHLGDSATALETLEWLKGGDQRRDGADMDRAFIQVALGQHNQALTSLQLAMEAGRAPAWNGWYVRSELNPLRGDRRFEELIRPRK